MLLLIIKSLWLLNSIIVKLPQVSQFALWSSTALCAGWAFVKCSFCLANTENIGKEQKKNWRSKQLFDTSAICVEVTDTSSTEKLSPSRSMFAQEFLVHLQEKLETSQVKPSQAYSTRSSSIWGRYNSSWLPACNDISLEVNEDLSGVEHQVKVTQALDH